MGQLRALAIIKL